MKFSPYNSEQDKKAPKRNYELLKNQKLNAIDAFNVLVGGKKPEAANSNQKELIGFDERLSKIRQQQNIESRPNQFIEALNVAYDQHYPISLSPDMFWLCLAQSLSQHINLNSEKFRSKFVQHDGQKNIEVVRNHYVKGSDKNTWEDSFSEFSSKIKEHIGEKMHGILAPMFSTTGNIEKAAFEVTLMETMKNYFTYSCRTMCGFPEIELLGETSDWEKLKQQVQSFAEFDLEDWVKVLNPILDQLIETSKGNIDKSFWLNFFKEHGGSGGPYINGWINCFFLYLKRERKNNYCLDWNSKNFFSGTNPEDFLSGVSTVPFIWHYFNEKFDMEFLAGFCGYSQTEDGTIIPAIGWAVRDK